MFTPDKAYLPPQSPHKTAVKPPPRKTSVKSNTYALPSLSAPGVGAARTVTLNPRVLVESDAATSITVEEMCVVGAPP